MTGLLRDADGVEWGQAEQIAALLTRPDRRITAATIRKWAWRSRQPRDRLHGLLPSVPGTGPRTGITYYRLTDAAEVARLTGQS